MEEQKMKAPSSGQKSHGFAIKCHIEATFLLPYRICLILLQ